VHWQEAKSNLKNKAQNKINQVLAGGGKRKNKQTGDGVMKKRPNRRYFIN